MFSENQIKEIRLRLAACGVRDTQFDRAGSVGGDDLVAIVQDGDNRAVTVSALADYVTGGGSGGGQGCGCSALTDAEVEAIADGVFGS